MSRIFQTHPVGWPSAVAFVLGMLVFFSTLIMARLRANKNPKVGNAGQANITWLWIAVQGVGIGLAGMGRVDILTTTPTLAMIVRALVVLALMLAAVWLFDSSSRTMGKNWSLVARTRSDHVLVQTGPFALVRHPIYVALFLFMVAMAIAYGHTRNLLIGIPVFAFGTWMRIRHEERLLGEMFGGEYDAYAARVKRFVPGVF
ncbi:MAG: isoprenylcysteine carboxylmethyltransferase family protein [Sphingomonas bacterium]|uniref:methyltransferase family protein n=1 Tax=Sphingomonas bacterium TaxID=1895847 RepID=UPI00261DBD16|nr:isoprenylcysteine carboxylmethyltransferase family protein [Sphingomonas bacterium]MDB5711693.1 isoprenylcysteine carboxylmethyltransferase family protein [Sphingomonas bacterium]